MSNSIRQRADHDDGTATTQSEEVSKPDDVEAPAAASGLAEPEAEPDQPESVRLRQPDDPGPEMEEKKKSGWL
jgi:hypothetical protein